MRTLPLLAALSLLAARAWGQVPPPTSTPPPAPQPVAPAAPGPAPLAPAPAFETVVTAPAPLEPREDRAAAASVVFPAESPRAHDDLGDLLGEVPGLTVTRSGSLGAVVTLTMRGANPDEVRVYVDGVPLNLAEGGAVDISTLPLGDVERVEVYRGSTPLAFGESALGGVIAITTRTPGVPRASARAGAGSYGTMLADLSGGGTLGPLRIYAGAHALSSNGTFGGFVNDAGTALNPGDDSAGVRRNSDARQVDGVVRAALPLPGRRTLGLGAVLFAREQGLPGQSQFPALHARFQALRGLGYLRYESRDDLGPGGRLQAQLFALVERAALDDRLAEIGGTPLRTRDTTLSAGASAHASAPLLPWLRADAVLEARGERFQPVNELAAATPLPARRAVGTAGAELDLWWRRLDLEIIPSARVEAVQDVATARGVSTSGAPPAGATIGRALPILRLALVRPLGAAARLKANVGRYARMPTFLELYGDTGRRLGNAALRPERGDNADLALWIDAGASRVRVSSQTTAFAARVDDLIALQISPWGQAQSQNVASTRVLGVEQGLRLEIGRHLRVIGQATYTRAEDTGPAVAHHGRQLPLHPRWHGYGRTEVLRVAAGAVELGAFADADFRAGDYWDASNTVPLAARLLIGAGVHAQVPRWGLRLAANALDLTDARVPDMPNWPLPGRSIFLALSWESALQHEPGSQ